MRVSLASARVSRHAGQAFLEFAVVLPLVLLTILAVIQVALLAHARLRLEGALAAAARAFVVSGTTEEARLGAAYALAPASLPSGVTGGMGGSLALGLSRFVYAYAHTHVSACAAKREGDRSPLIVERGDPVRLDVSFDAPLVMPLAAKLLGDGAPAARSDSARAALQVSPMRALSNAALAKTLDAKFNRYPKRRLLGRTAVLWPLARQTTAPLPLCAV